MTAPDVAIAPPCAGKTRLMVSNSFAVGYDQSSLPSVALMAYSVPSDAPSKTTPGMTEAAAPSETPRPRPAGASAGAAGANSHARSPVAGLIAASPPPPMP